MALFTSAMEEDELSRSTEFDAISFDEATASAVDDRSVVAVATRAERLALRILQLGAVVVVVAAAAYRAYELDRFFVPKELTLHLTAVLVGLLTVRAFRRVRFTWTDLLLFGFLLLGVISAALATNPWLGARALAISASGVVLFWTARALSGAGLDRPLLAALAAAIVVGCATSLLQAYGIRTDIFSLNRAPGGTLGNRNFVAHMAAFGLPVVLLVGLRAKGAARYAVATVGAALVTASLVLTRSRCRHRRPGRRRRRRRGAGAERVAVAQ
jgi:hypothetical protein